MLYKTTRNSGDGYTAQRVLTQKRGPDGGLYVPFRVPVLSEREISMLGERSFNTNLADTLNLLFGVKLTAYDIDFVLGRYSVRLQQLGQKIIMAECWHNTDWQFGRMIQDLSLLVLSDKSVSPELSGWSQTGVRIGVLFGIFGELIRNGLACAENKIDISVVSGDFSAPMAAWYGRTMGLPIGNIVCCCNENAVLWNFICHGQLRTDGIAMHTLVPEANVSVPEGLECLISMYGGTEETKRYVEAVRTGTTYYVDDNLLQRLRQGIYVTVTSERRILSTVPDVYSTHKYLLALSSALAYAGLQNYRSRTGDAKTALVITEKSPAVDSRILSELMGVSEQDIQKML